MTKFAAFLIFATPLCADAAEPCADIAETALGAALDQPGPVYDLGVFFYTGRCASVPKSYENAAKMWRKAADLGVMPAKNNLGYLLHTGLAGREDKEAAVRLWTEAAAAGYPESQSHLGTAYFYGSGVAKDETKGLAWVLLAIESASIRPASAAGGGGDAVLKDALNEKEKMLRTAPGLLEDAQVLKGTLLTD